MQDLFNVLLASLYSVDDTDPIPRWGGGIQGTGETGIYFSYHAVAGFMGKLCKLRKKLERISWHARASRVCTSCTTGEPYRRIAE